MIKKAVKNIMEKNRVLRPVLIGFRRVRLMVSALKLPKYLKVKVSENDYFLINTRNWPSSSFCLRKRDGEYVVHEDVETELFKKEVGKGSTVIDAGAHIGYYSLLAASLGADKIYAFEVLDSFANEVEKQAKVNSFEKRIEVINKPLGLAGKEIRFGNYGERVVKRAVSLDDFCSERNIKPDFIKVDIEGGETDFVKGALRTIESVHPTMIISVHPDFLSVSQIDVMIKDLIRADCRIYPISCSKPFVSENYIGSWNEIKNRKEFTNNLLVKG